MLLLGGLWVWVLCCVCWEGRMRAARTHACARAREVLHARATPLLLPHTPPPAAAHHHAPHMHTRKPAQRAAPPAVTGW